MNNAAAPVAFQIAELSFALTLTGERLSIESYDLTVSHPDGGSAVYELQLWRGEWVIVRERGGNETPIEIWEIVSGFVASLTACGYYGRLLQSARYSVAACVAEALSGAQGLAVAS